jgi:hypothetical protein
MLDQTYVTDALPVVVAPSAFVDIPYSPGLLLPVPFDGSITTNPEYQQACKGGFDGYFEMLFTWTENGEYAPVDRFYSHNDIRQVVVNDVIQGVTEEHSSLAFCAGDMVGWLSALALTDRSLASYGLSLLVAVIGHLRSCGWS